LSEVFVARIALKPGGVEVVGGVVALYFGGEGNHDLRADGVEEEGEEEVEEGSMRNHCEWSFLGGREW